MNHQFRISLPNGLHVEAGGEKEFVAGVYADVKSAAIVMFDRHARSEALPPATVLSSPGDTSPAPQQLPPPSVNPDPPPAPVRRRQQRGAKRNGRAPTPLIIRGESGIFDAKQVGKRCGRHHSSVMLALRKAEKAGLEWTIYDDLQFKRAPGLEDDSDQEPAANNGAASDRVARAMRSMSRITRTSAV